MATFFILFQDLQSWTNRKLLCFLISVLALIILYVLIIVHRNLIASPLSPIPGPKIFALTKWRLAYEDYRGTRTRSINGFHKKYGDIVRIGPNEVSFNSSAALKAIYGAGSGFWRDKFYRMFDAYGRQVMFSFASPIDHRERKKLLNQAYSKTTVLSPRNTAIIEEKTRQFLSLVERESRRGIMEIFNPLHYYSMDTISRFLYGESQGATTALTSSDSRGLLDDIINPSRRKLSWFIIHFPRLTNWLYTRTGVMELILTMFGLLPMSKPPTYTGVRHHALVSAENLQDQSIEDPTESIAARLFHFMRAGKKGPAMDFLDVASECSDHLLAGIDTTSVTLMFAIFALSQQENREFQDKLRQEIKSISNEFVVDDVVNALAADKLPYLDAVIKETLRLYAPLPGSEPRWSANAEIIDGYHIPAHTVVSMSPYCLHRNEQVFEDPLNFNPNRWLGQSEQVTEMKRWFWAFSSGSRMCIGMHLAMAEMTTLLASVYRKYKTEIVPQFTGVSPGVTARYEVFYDEKFEKIEEHECWVMFKT